MMVQQVLQAAPTKMTNATNDRIQYSATATSSITAATASPLSRLSSSTNNCNNNKRRRCHPVTTRLEKKVKAFPLSVCFVLLLLSSWRSSLCWAAASNTDANVTSKNSSHEKNTEARLGHSSSAAARRNNLPQDSATVLKTLLESSSETATTAKATIQKTTQTSSSQNSSTLKQSHGESTQDELQQRTEQRQQKLPLTPPKQKSKRRSRSVSRLLRKLQATTGSSADTTNGTIRVIVGYRNSRGQQSAQDKSLLKLNINSNSNPDTASAQSVQVPYSYLQSRLNVVPAVLDAESLEALDLDPDIYYIEEDEKVRLFQTSTEQASPYGRKMIQATLADEGSQVPQAPSATQCTDPNAFKIAIIDSGVEANHPDLPCRWQEGMGDINCIGKEFGIDGSVLPWYVPSDNHGTMVTGIVGAVSNNDQGLIGVSGIASTTNICWVITRVFASVTDEAYLSDIFEGVAWAVAQGVKVINMSLGGPGSSYTGRTLYQKLWNDDGIIVVAASGNAGTHDYSFPASYPGVVSVSAIAEDYSLARYSQSNDAVDVCAPGDQILSTARLNQGNTVWFMSLSGSPSMAIATRLFEGSKTPPSTGYGGPLAICSTIHTDTCPTALGQHVCLTPLLSVDLLVVQQANCYAGGGVAMVVYNDRPGDFTGFLDYVGSIPVYSISQAYGQALGVYAGSRVDFVLEDGYAFADGTSFAAPHVTGAVARIWQVCPSCSNADVVNCLEGTTLDLGDAGKDDLFGNGMIQIVAAYQCLVNTNGCCAAVTQESSSSSTAPQAMYNADLALEQVSTATPEPTALTEASDEGYCQSEDQTYVTCLDYDLDFFAAQSCVDCLSPSIPSDLKYTDCSQISNSICPALETCSCGGCLLKIQQYLSCVVASTHSDDGCVLDCSAWMETSTPTTSVPLPVLTTSPPATAAPSEMTITSEIVAQSSSPTVFSPPASDFSSYTPTNFSTLAPTTSPTCAAELSVYQSCFVTEMDSEQGSYCRNCVNNQIPDGGSLSGDCSSVSSQVCLAIDVCNCNICRTEIETYLGCLFDQTDGCTVDCGFLTTPEPTTITAASGGELGQCLNAQDEFVSCFTTMDEAKAGACRACVNSQTSGISGDCDSTASNLCSAITQCDCDGCFDQIYTYLDCAYTASDGCSFDCNALNGEANFKSTGNEKLPSATIEPTPVDRCLSERKAYAVCSAGQLLPEEASSCNKCVIRALREDDVDCDSFASNICLALDSCNCNDCRETLEDFISCESNTGKCPIDCAAVASNEEAIELSSEQSAATGKSLFSLATSFMLSFFVLWAAAHL